MLTATWLLRSEADSVFVSGQLDPTRTRTYIDFNTVYFVTFGAMLRDSTSYNLPLKRRMEDMAFIGFRISNGDNRSKSGGGGWWASNWYYDIPTAKLHINLTTSEILRLTSDSLVIKQVDSNLSSGIGYYTLYFEKKI